MSLPVPETGASLPLAGLRVLDMATDMAELCGRLLADLGADVVRVEPPGGSPSRALPPLWDGRSLYFEVRNTNKRSTMIDLRGAAGRARLERMLERADVWIEAHRPGRLAGAGFDPVSVSEAHPSLVVASVTAFGLTGPYRDYEATDDVVAAMAGAIFRSGAVGRPPLLAPGSLAYDIAGVTAAFGVLAALWQRARTGLGQHLDVSALEATAQVTDWSLPNYSAISAAGGPYQEVRSGSGIVYPLYPCKDGWVRLVVLSARQWHALRQWLGDPDFLQDPHWDSLLSRMSIQADILDPLYEELFSTMGMAELSAEAQRRGIVMTPVMDPSSVLAAEHYRERGALGPYRFADGSTEGAAPTGFMELDGRRVGRRSPAPALGGADPVEDGSWADRPAPWGTGATTGDSPALLAPLAGLLVADFGHGGVGVEAARMLADCGADVIKVESRSYPDFIRLVAGSETSPSFASSNRSKRSLGLNVKTGEGLALARRLAERADVLIENNSTGTMDRLGLGWADVSAVNPDLIMVSSQLMGSSGPWARWLGYGPSTRPAGGMTWLWNWPDGGPPPGAQVIFPDHLVGRLCACAALAGLLGRSTGGGAHYEVAQVETVLEMMGQYLLAESLQPGSVRPLGNRRERGVPWGMFPCSGTERWCAVTVRDDTDWANLREALEKPQWARDPALETLAGRRSAEDEIERRLGEWTVSRTDREVMETLQAHRVPAGYMAYASDQPGDPHLRARGYPVHIEQPGVGPMILEGPAFRGSRMAPPSTRPAPGLGEHTREVAAELLGLSEEETERLVEAGVLEV